MITALLMVFTTALPANAQAGTVTVPLPIRGASVTVEWATADMQKMQDQAESWDSLDADSLADLQRSYDRSGRAPASGLSLDTAAATGWKIDENLSVLRVPIAAGQGVLQASSLEAFFNGAGELTDVVEFNFVSESADSGIVRTWLNGELVLNELVTAPTQSSSAEPGGGTVSPMFTRGDWWGNFNECLSNAGIPAWVITGISIACAAICIVTVGTGCLVCIAAAAGGWGGTIGACIVVANTYT